MEERRTKEVAFLEERFKRVEKNENELHMLRIKDAEEYNEMKVKLETDVQVKIFINASIFYLLSNNLKIISFLIITFN